jgi:hypothetical protein
VPSVAAIDAGAGDAAAAVCTWMRSEDNAIVWRSWIRAETPSCEPGFFRTAEGPTPRVPSEYPVLPLEYAFECPPSTPRSTPRVPFEYPPSTPRVPLESPSSPPRVPLEYPLSAPRLQGRACRARPARCRSAATPPRATAANQVLGPGTHGVLLGYSRGTHGVRTGYSPGTHRVLTGFARWYSPGTHRVLTGFARWYSRGTHGGVLTGYARSTLRVHRAPGLC